MEQTQLKRPDPRVRISWSVYALLFSPIAGIVTAVLLDLPFIPRWVAWAFLGACAAVLLFLLLVYIPLRCRNARYAVDDERICVVSGVYTVSRRVMPLSRVRHITVIRGPLERAFGTAFVVVAAAGGHLLLEGVPAKEALRWSESFMFR